MKLIIKEYLTQLKESGELDLLLPDLLLSMGLTTISRPQIGVRQYGVDIAAKGKINQDSTSIFLFTIKQGDISRADWDTGIQAIRPSLNEIIDSYIPTYISKKDAHKKKKIILCTGGIIKQEVEKNWRDYTDKYTTEHIEFDFWGGDELSILIEQYMFSEYLIPKIFQSQFRRTLALIADNDYDLSDYTSLLQNILQRKDIINNKKQAHINDIKKRLTTIHLCNSIIFAWAKESGNIKNAVIAAEKTVLLTWDYIYKNNLVDNSNIIQKHWQIQNGLLKAYNEYVYKIHKHCGIEDGLSGYERHHILVSLNIYEQLGIVATYGINCIIKSDIEKNMQLRDHAQNACNIIKDIISNNNATKSPLYDNHSIEISESIFLLGIFSEWDFIQNWISEMIGSIGFSYINLGRYFPINTDSFDDLVALNVAQSIDKVELSSISTLLPTLAQWCALFNLENCYTKIYQLINNVFPHTTLQMWYPDKETDNYIYTKNAAYHSGAVDAPITLPESIEKMKEMIIKVQKNTISIDELSSVKRGFSSIPIISSRHFRTPFLPQYIHITYLNEQKSKLRNA